MLLGDGGKMQVRWIVGTYRRVGAFFCPKFGKTPPKVRRKDDENEQSDYHGPTYT